MGDGPSYDELKEIGSHILERTKHRPQLGIVCGSGLGGLAEVVEEAQIFEYKDIPGFPVSTVAGHSGKLVLGLLKGKCVVLMRGRFHHYEGYPMWKTTLPIRVMKFLGVKTLFLTNAAGGLNPDFRVGDIMIIRDHIDLPGLTGECVLRSTNDERFGPRFLATVDSYDKDLSDIAKLAASDLKLGDLIQEGVYVMIGGPTFETVAESRLLRNFGADAVGMSTVAEAVVARHMGMKVLGISLITDMCSLSYGDKPGTTHEEVLAIGQKRAKDMQGLAALIVERMPID